MGISGLLFARHLVDLGLRVTVLDQKPDAGGTWAPPHYPGQRVDIAGHVYWPKSFDPVTWDTVFPVAQNLANYLADETIRIADRCTLVFSADVNSLTWMRRSATWEVRYRDKISNSHVNEKFDFVVLAPGKLSSANVPLANAGALANWHHSSSFNMSNLDNRKPICVVGSAASGIQLATQLSLDGYKVHLFQRTPSWILPTPSYRKESSTIIRNLQGKDPVFALLYRLFYVSKSIRGNLDSVVVDSGMKNKATEISEKNLAWKIELEDYIRSLTAGTRLPTDWLIPKYPPGARRLVLDDGEYLSAISNGRIVLRGGTDVRTQQDVEKILRLTNSVPENLVWATGFNTSAWADQILVKGEIEENLRTLIYNSGLHYKGVMAPGYPNLFFAWGPNTNVVVSGSNTHMMEMQAEFMGKVITSMAQDGHRKVSVGFSAVESYSRSIRMRSMNYAWGASSVKSWYTTPGGLSIENWPGDTLDYFKELLIDTLEGLDFS
jgi:4-hydroxyacetophenone monooxygenase